MSPKMTITTEQKRQVHIMNKFPIVTQTQFKTMAATTNMTQIFMNTAATQPADERLLKRSSLP